MLFTTLRPFHSTDASASERFTLVRNIAAIGAVNRRDKMSICHAEWNNIVLYSYLVQPIYGSLPEWCLFHPKYTYILWMEIIPQYSYIRP